MFGRSLPCYIGGSEQVISARLIQVLPGNWGGVGVAEVSFGTLAKVASRSKQSYHRGTALSEPPHLQK